MIPEVECESRLAEPDVRAWQGLQDSCAQHASLAEVQRRFFSDETEAFRSPAQPQLGQRVTVRLRADAGFSVQADLLVGAKSIRVPMVCTRSDGLFEWYEATLQCGLEPLTYRFSITCDGQHFVYRKSGASLACDASPDDVDFRIVPGFRVPTWAQGALQYQIFPDRFANGDSSNDVVDAEYAYDEKHVRKAERWDAPIAEDDYRCFYGGDLRGVIGKLDYLQSLGVEAIYLNPIFVSPSSHKYDTQDYFHIDPHLGVIVDDLDCPLEDGALNNAHASQYICRTTSAANLAQSDELFAELCREIHDRGMRIILDGVFNHCGSFSAWLDREGVYRCAGVAELGAYQDPNSPYRRYFSFKDNSTSSYESWWGFPTLPKLNYEQSEELQERILDVARKWAMPPYCIDGWRLDVAADLGHSQMFNHMFWRRFRTELKRVNPELLIVAEHYGDPSSWLQGDQWDTTMNYDAFMDPLTYFLTGMEKHSDGFREDLYQNGDAFWASMSSNMAHYGWGSLLCAMTELSNHDHSRFLTRTNRTVGRLHTAGADAAGENVDKRVLREAVVVQMTWPGAPTIYYGDEAGQVGWTDPDCRRTYPWGREDAGLVELHRELAHLRSEHPALRAGSLVRLGCGHGWIAFGRFAYAQGGRKLADCMAVACNNLDDAQVVTLRLRTIGVADESKVEVCLRTTGDGFSSHREVIGKVADGVFTLFLEPKSALVLRCC